MKKLFAILATIAMCLTLAVTSATEAKADRTPGGNVSYSNDVETQEIGFTAATVESGIELKWNLIPNVTAFKIQKKRLNAAENFQDVYEATANRRTSYVDRSIESGVTYQYRIMLISGGDFTNPYFSSGWKLSDPVAFYCIPTLKKVTNVVSGIHVYWDRYEGVANYYVLYRSETKTGNYKKIATLNSNTLDYTDTTVKSGVQYYYKMKVQGQQGTSPASPALSKTFVGTPDLTTRVNTSSGIRLGWDKIEGATGYAIYRKEVDNLSSDYFIPFEVRTTSWVRVATISGNNKFTWTDPDTAGNHNKYYSYTVRAFAGPQMNILSGCYSNGRTMIRLETPQLTNAEKATDHSISCAWSSYTVDGYEVRFMADGKVYKTFCVGNFRTHTKAFNTLASGKNYKIQVRSYVKTGATGTYYSAWSNELYVQM